MTESQNIEDKSDMFMHENSGIAMLKRLRINKLVGMFVQEFFDIFWVWGVVIHCHAVKHSVN